MNRGRVILALVFVLPTLVAAEGSERSSIGPSGRPAPVFVPDPSPELAPLLDGEIWTFTTDRYEARLAQIDERTRQRFLEERFAATTDPFASPPGRQTRFLTFLLVLENRGDGQLFFESQNCILTVRNKEILHPMDLSTIQSIYGLLDREMPPAYEAAREALFDGQVILGSGERTSGLLIYETVKPRTRRFTLQLQIMTASGEVLRFKARYRRAKP